MLKKPRIHIIFEKKTAILLENLAHQENKSVSTLTRELVLEALERREDMALSTIAEKRDTKGAKKVGHHDVCKRNLPAF